MMPPDLDRLRELRNYEIREVLVDCALDLLDNFDELVNSHFWLLSLVESGGRLVVEQPCKHGEVEDHSLVDDYGGFVALCVEGSRTVVWPTDKER